METLVLIRPTDKQLTRYTYTLNQARLKIADKYCHPIDVSIIDFAISITEALEKRGQQRSLRGTISKVRDVIYAELFTCKEKDRYLIKSTSNGIEFVEEP